MDYAVFVSSTFFLAFSLCFSPGPNNTLCMAMGMTHGLRSIFPYSFGMVLGALVTFLLTAFGLGKIFQTYPALFHTLRAIGAAYLLWLALHIVDLDPLAALTRRLLHRKKPAKSAGETKRPLSFTQGFTFQFINVKVWVGHAIAVSTYAGADEYMWHRIAILGFMFSLFGWLANLTWGIGGVAMTRFLSSEGVRRANYLFAASLALSVLLLFFQ